MTSLRHLTQFKAIARFLKIIPLLWLGSTCPSHALTYHISYVYNDDAAKRAQVEAAMNEAVAVYNAQTNIDVDINVSYHPGIPTAQSDYNGTLGFGGSINTQVALHEIAHYLGSGTTNEWEAQWGGDNVWDGAAVRHFIKMFDGPGAELYRSGVHYYPYGFNYGNEDSPIARFRLPRLIQAMRLDMGFQDGDGDGMSDEWERYKIGTTSQSAAGDADGDGISNYDEWWNESDPMRACPVRNGRTYILRSRLSQKVMEAADTTAGANVRQNPLSGSDLQKWTATSVGSGYWKFINLASGKALEVGGFSTAAGGNIMAWNDTGGTNQQWRIVEYGGIYSKLFNRNSSNMVIDVDGGTGATGNGANISQYDDNINALNQEWVFDDVTPTDPPGNLMAQFKLDGSAWDSSGRGLHGTVSGGVTYTTGRVDSQAATFNGTDASIEFPAPVDTNFTLACWVKTAATAGTGQWYQGMGIIDGEVPGVAKDFGLALVGNKAAFGVGNPDITITSNVAINDNVWHHVLATLDTGTGAMRLYVDGALQASGTGPTGARTAPSKLYLGSIGGVTRFFNGSLDEVRIYNKILSSTEINHLATIGQTSIAYYPFDGNVSDLSTFSNHGIATGITYGVGKIGTQAAQFDGTGSFVRLPATVSGDFTVGYWMKTTATGGTGQWYNGKSIIDAEVPGVAADWGIALVGNKVGFGIGNPDKTILSTTAVNDGVWHYVMATRINTTGAMKLYIDGQLQVSDTGPVGPRNAAGGMRLGSTLYGGSYFAGSIDDLNIFNYALTPDGGTATMSITAANATGSNLTNNGTLVFAWNVNGIAANPLPVVNGMTFANTAPASGPSAAISGFPAAVNEVGGATQAHYSGDMARVMGDFVGTNFSTNGTVTLSGLTVGSLYRVQFLHHQDINNDAQRTLRVLFGAGPSATAYAGAGDDIGYVSNVVFTAAAATQIFTLNPTTGARAMLNGVVLHKDPVVAMQVNVSNPVSRQVVQRDGTNTGDIPISGTYNGSFDRIEARAVVMAGAGNNGTTTAWSTIASTLSGGAYSGTLNDVPAGGWYQIEVRSVTGGIPETAVTVTRVGVGDVYLTGGQSNAANRGFPLYSPGVDRFSALNYSTAAWTLAADPMPGASVTVPTYQGSVWSRLGEILVNRDNVPVAMVCFAESGSDITRWLPANNDLYPRIRTAVQSFPQNGFRGILWHQGETNATNGNTAAAYQSWLTTIIGQSRVDAGWTIPWYVAEASYIQAGLAKEEPIVAGQRAVIFADSQVFPGPVTDNFHQEDKVIDGVHFNAEGMLDHATQWSEVLGGTPPLAPKNADFESNTALADGGIAVIDTASTSSPSVIGWRALNAANTGAADGSCGYYNPNSSSYANASDTGPNGGVLPGMLGKQVAFISNSLANACFLQTRRSMLQAGRTYTLAVALGVRTTSVATFGGATVELLADGNVIASRSIDRAGLDALNSGNASGTFTDIAFTYTPDQTVTAGKPLAIRIRKIGGANTYIDFDNVRLTVAVTPFASWQVAHFGSSLSVDAAWDADPDGDSLNNAFEYYLGLDPAHSDAPTFLSDVTRSGGPWVRYRVPLDPAVDSSSLGLWYSFDLSGWQPAATEPDGTVVEARAADEWSLEISRTAHPRAFFQLRAGPPP
ncbi:MAG: LamG-like jellyroll fold domain-containing protein [Luteolibacter sp.]|uniref:LamG-like jellyroll fold domain-containing protein n=1 Tax=Luteolibacter sp. TaxID=1962973 RepID=UPI003266693F